MKRVIRKIESLHRISLGRGNERNSGHLGDALLSPLGKLKPIYL